VSRATDTKLDCDVAIKVLPAEVAHEAERLGRFEREAKRLGPQRRTSPTSRPTSTWRLCRATPRGLRQLLRQPPLVSGRGSGRRSSSSSKTPTTRAVKRGAIVVAASRDALPHHVGLRRRSIVRLALPPGERTGLKSVSQVMINQVVRVLRVAIGAEIGECRAEEMESGEDGFRRWLGMG
jgi:mRNA-degrading endonuclease toxin of MazEF toxin-antitoxin module